MTLWQLLEVQVRKKPEGVKVEDAMLLDTGFLHQTALTIQSHLWEKTGNYNGEIFILIKLIPLFTKNSSLQHLLMLCQERCRCPTMTWFLIFHCLNAISLHQITAIQSLSFISTLFLNVFPSGLLKNPNLTQFRTINFPYYSHHSVPIYFQGSPWNHL